IIIKNDLEQAENCFCRINKENKKISTDFEYEILIDKKMYSYGFSILMSEKKILREWLYQIDKQTEKDITIFTFDYINNSKELNIHELSQDSTDQRNLATYISDFLDLEIFEKSLFLYFINDKKRRFSEYSHANALNSVYQWFLHTLEVISPKGTTRQGLTYLKDKDNSLEEFLKDFGTEISEVIPTQVSEEELYRLEKREFVEFLKKEIIDDFEVFLKKSDIKIDKSKETDRVEGTAIIRSEKNLLTITVNDKREFSYGIIRFKHYDGQTYTLGEESDGTIRLLELYGILKDTKNKVFIVDELDRSLHPNLTYNFIKKYLSMANPTQLIVSTHEDRILDLDLMRRDEIWFVENTNGNSRLYSLEEFKARFDLDITNAYLSGRYGSIPKFNFLK
ncbi:MAG: AAA family ATPase, partial [Wohlfahrtiimonas sp.]